MKNKLVFVLASLLTLGAVLLPVACNFEHDSNETVLLQKQAAVPQGLEPVLNWETFVAYRPVLRPFELFHLQPL